MHVTPLTLAAYAISAIPELIVERTWSIDDDEEMWHAGLSTALGELSVRVPRTEAAEVRLTGERLAWGALTEGSRAALPFEVPRALGVARAKDTIAVVSTRVDGERVEVADIAPDARLIQSIVESMAAIHELPHAHVRDAGLPVRTASESRSRIRTLVARAHDTGFLPATVREHWDSALADDALWDFEPCLVHGSLDSSSLRLRDDTIVAVHGWSALSIDDPALDFTWLLGGDAATFDVVHRRYLARMDSAGRGGTGREALRVRAAFLHEVDVAKWLLHGVESHSKEITDDAVTMLDRLVGNRGPLQQALGTSTLRNRSGHSVDDVQALLDDTPSIPNAADDREAHSDESLDEDRMFSMDTDIVEPLQPELGEPEPEAPEPEDSEFQDSEPGDTTRADS